MQRSDGRPIPLRVGRCLVARNVTGALLLFLAACQPFVLASGSVPSPTALNQMVALLAWGGVCLWAGLSMRATAAEPLVSALASRSGRAASPWELGIRIFLASALAWAGSSSIASGLPASLWLPLVGVPATAWLCGEAGHRLASVSDVRVGAALAVYAGLVSAGLLTAIAGLIQVYWPELASTDLIAPPPGGGRAYGNLRQPNQMCTLILWALVAALALREMLVVGPADAHPRADRSGFRLSWHWSTPALAAGVALTALLLVLSGSRTGALATLTVALWGALDRRLWRSTRWLACSLPLAYCWCWWALRIWSQRTGNSFGAERLLGQLDNVSSSRFDIWTNTMELIRASPWQGVGWGNFNFAWTLTPFADRPQEFFDHTHNLPLQLAVELGVPGAAVLMFASAWAIWRAWISSAAAKPAASAAGRGFAVMLVVVGLHSLLEYPLWYTYFLLPAAFMLGFALGTPGPCQRSPKRERLPAPSHFRLGNGVLTAGSGLCLVGTLWAVADLRAIGSIFEAGSDAPPLTQRIEQGKRRLFFAHHAHYAAATVAPAGVGSLGDFDIAGRNLLDTRLMLAWSQALQQQGDTKRSQHIAQRLREFGVPGVPGLPPACATVQIPPTSVTTTADKGSRTEDCREDAPSLAWRDFVPSRETRNRP